MLKIALEMGNLLGDEQAPSLDALSLARETS